MQNIVFAMNKIVFLITFSQRIKLSTYLFNIILYDLLVNKYKFIKIQSLEKGGYLLISDVIINHLK